MFNIFTKLYSHCIIYPQAMKKRVTVKGLFREPRQVKGGRQYTAKMVLELLCRSF